jgi:hypothetical protein
LDEQRNDLRDHMELEFARVEINTEFAHWHWTGEQVRDLVNSHSRYNLPAFAVLFAGLRREARLAEISWISALYTFRALKQSEDRAGNQTNDGRAPN